MDFDIGQLKVKTSPAVGDANFTKMRLRHPALVGRKSRHVYLWQCRLGKKNPARPTYFTLEHHLSLTALRATGQVNAAETTAIAARLTQASGLANIQAVDAAVGQVFPPTTVRIPWKDLDRAMTTRNSVHVVAWVGYQDMYVTPKTGPTGDHYILSVPIAVKFQAIVVWMCFPFGSTILIRPRDREKAVRLPISPGPAADLGREYDDHLRDLRQSDPASLETLTDQFKRETERRETRSKTHLTDDLEDLLDEIDGD